MASTCPHPFINESLFPNTGGSVTSRWCDLLNGVSCCLPCPVAYWRWQHVIYDVRLGVWPSIPVLLSLVWLLVTYIIFPEKVTQRHYLNVAPTIGFMCISIAFIIPAKGLPRECYNDITPNDMRTNALSALFGIVMYFGAWVVIISAFFRSLALHLTVVWEVKLSNLYKNISLTFIFAGSIALVIVLLTISGMEYTFGRISYIVPNHDRATFWGPLLAISASSLSLQFITINYCAFLVLRPWFRYQKLRWKGYTPSFDFERDRSIQQTAAQIRNVIKLQWRNSLITVIILIYVCFLAGVFMQLRQFHEYAESDRRAWFECLQSSRGDKLECLPLAGPLGPSEAELIAVLFLLVLSGTLALAFFFRIPMIQAWIELFQGKRRFRRTATPASRLSYPSRPDVGDFDMEMPDRSSSGRFSQPQFSPSDTGSLTRPQTIPTSLA